MAEFHDCDISGYEIKSTRLEDLARDTTGRRRERKFSRLDQKYDAWRPEDRKSAGELLKHSMVSILTLAAVLILTFQKQSNRSRLRFASKYT